MKADHFIRRVTISSARAGERFPTGNSPAAAGPDVMRVLELFAECKGQQPDKPSILYYHRPHLGSNRLPAVVKAIRRKIEEFGGECGFSLESKTWCSSGMS